MIVLSYLAWLFCRNVLRGIQIWSLQQLQLTVASDCGYQIIVYFDLYKVEFVHKYYFCMDLNVNVFFRKFSVFPVCGI